MKNMIKNNPALVMIILMFMSTIGVRCVQHNTIYENIFCRLVLGFILLIILYIITNGNVCYCSKESWIYTLKKGWYPVVFNFLVSTFVFFKYSLTTYNAVNNNIYQIFILLIYCISIGFFEELLFRGIISSGLTKLMSKNKLGVLWSIIISSFFFGFVHVWQYIFQIEKNPMPIIIQMLCVTLSNGCVGMLFTVLYYKTKNLWACIILHALIDFFPLLVCTVLGISKKKYVNIYQAIDLTILLPQIISICLLAIPCLLISIKIIKQLDYQKCVMWK